MPLPADLDLVTVRGKYVRLDGTAVVGNVTFATANVLTDAASLTTVVPATLPATLDAGGAFTINLPASDDPDVSPSGWTYTVTENFAGGRGEYAITVPVAAKTTGIDLATVAPNPPAATNGTQAFVLLGAHEQLAARVAALEAGGGGGTAVTIGTTAGTVAAGNDPRIVNAVQSTTIDTLVTLTQTAYDALTPAARDDPAILYVITGA